jgi:hypothetical protein
LTIIFARKQSLQEKFYDACIKLVLLSINYSVIKNQFSDYCRKQSPLKYEKKRTLFLTI